MFYSFLVTDIKAQPLCYSLNDYHNAPIRGPLNSIWKDTPHRLLYDLIAAVKHYAELAEANRLRGV